MTTPRIAIAGRDAQQRQWLRHHLQTLWSDANPPSIDLEQLTQQLQETTDNPYEVVVLCADFEVTTMQRCESLALLRKLRRMANLPALIVVANSGNELTAVRAMGLGVAAYLPRQLLDAQRLGGTLRKVLHATRRRRQREERRRPGAATARAPTIPGYTLLRELGSSTRASVWLARSAALECPVALKVSTPERASAVDGPHFAREYAAIAAIRNPAVVDIFDYGVHDGREFIAMEYFPCGDLKQRLLHPLSTAQALNYARRIGAALCVTHAAGIVHRDMKPPNVMLRADGSVVLIDFGLAKRLGADTHSTAVGVLRGSPYYMSPEQALGQTLDGRSDIYSLGVVCYEMLTGHKPYHGLTAMELMQQHVSGERPALPPELGNFEPVLARLMARDRDQRYADAAQALAALDTLATQSTPNVGAAHAA